MDFVKYMYGLGPAFFTAAVLLGLLIMLWRAKVSQDKQHRTDMRETHKEHKDEMKDLLHETISMQKATTTAMVTVAEVLRTLDRKG